MPSKISLLKELARGWREHVLRERAEGESLSCQRAGKIGCYQTANALITNVSRLERLRSRRKCSFTGFEKRET
jgi:hypothetical protein